MKQLRFSNPRDVKPVASNVCQARFECEVIVFLEFVQAYSLGSYFKSFTATVNSKTPRML
jgi:hypothetical protein